MNGEESKEILILKDEVLGIKEEIIKLNNLAVDLIREIKINLGVKRERENSKEIDDLLKKCLNNF